MANRLDVRWFRSCVGLVVGVGMTLILAHGARGQVAFELLHGFGEGFPPSLLIQAADGDFYGATSGGGTFGGGTLFKVTAPGTVTTLHSFRCDTEGCQPNSLIQASDGNFYGTTYSGGGPYGLGTVFKLTAAGSVTTLHSFDCGTAGCQPTGLIQASDGDFYGTTDRGGGPFGGGTVFKLTPAGAITPLHSFDCATEGCPPRGLIQASDGNFYGTTNGDGTAGGGTVFKLTAAGTFTTLHHFSAAYDEEGVFHCSTEGCGPSHLIQASDGNFYGTTPSGGTTRFGGTVFKITGAGAVTTVHSFDCNTEGCGPSLLIQVSDGSLYGTARYGGKGGTVFKITGAGAVTTVHSFDCGAEACQPDALIQARDGNFYGTTLAGPVGDPSHSAGTVFELTPSGTLTTLHPFGCVIEGCGPNAGLIQARDGNFYGTTGGGGTFGGGTIFRITPSGTLTTLHSFDPDVPGEGYYPVGSLIQARDGNFYGTTVYGGDGTGLGTGDGGTVFKIDGAGTFTTLHTFHRCGEAEGCTPFGGLIQASDGDFYGTTASGGNGVGVGAGTIFKITAAGIFTTLYIFRGDDSDGVGLYAGLIQASDGYFYGTTQISVFKLTASGTLTKLHALDSPNGLIQASDGNFYGTTAGGGTAGAGAIFRLTPSGILTTLHSFDCTIEGCYPQVGLIQANDGNLYGSADPTFFKITPGGSYTVINDISGCGATGCGPSSLIQASDGNLYGTNSQGGGGGGGTVFRLVGRLSPLSPARVWIGLKNSDDAGLRLDLLAEVFAGGTKIGEGRLENVSAGGNGFNNAVLNAIPLDRIGDAAGVPAGSALEVKLSVRRTCSGSGHAAGTARLWYNGQPVDSGSRRDAGSRLDVITPGAITSNFLLSEFALSIAPAASRQAIDVSVDSKQSCPNRAFKSFGTWSHSP